MNRKNTPCRKNSITYYPIPISTTYITSDNPAIKKMGSK